MTTRFVLPSFLCLVLIYIFFGREAYHFSYAIWIGSLGGFVAGRAYLEKVDRRMNFESWNFAIPAFSGFLVVTFFMFYFDY